MIRAELGGWSRDGMVRQAAFKGSRRAATPRPSRARTPVATTTAVKAAEAEAPPMPRRAIESRRATPKAAKTTAKPRRRRRPRAAPSRDPDAWRVTDDELAALDALGKEGVWRVGGATSSS